LLEHRIKNFNKTTTSERTKRRRVKEELECVQFDLNFSKQKKRQHTFCKEVNVNSNDDFIANNPNNKYYEENISTPICNSYKQNIEENCFSSGATFCNVYESYYNHSLFRMESQINLRLFFGIFFVSIPFH